MIDIVLVLGFGKYSSEAREKMRNVINMLRRLGIKFNYSEITIPILDDEGFTPELLIDGTKYSILVEEHVLLESIIAYSFEKYIGGIDVTELASLNLS